MEQGRETIEKGREAKERPGEGRGCVTNVTRVRFRLGRFLSFAFSRVSYGEKDNSYKL